MSEMPGQADRSDVDDARGYGVARNPQPGFANLGAVTIPDSGLTDSGAVSAHPLIAHTHSIRPLIALLHLPLSSRVLKAMHGD
jgi:hypothetical protein